MDLLDAGLVVLVAVGIFSGWRRGLTWVGLSFAGLVLGILLGAAVAPRLAHHFGNQTPSSEALIGIGVFLACVALVQGIGTAVGYRIRVAALRTSLAEVDSGAGASMAAVGVLILAWFFGITFAQSQYTLIVGQVNGSGILRTIDRAFPRPPSFLNSLSSLLRDPNFGNPFDHLGEGNLGAIDNVPSDVPVTPGVRTAISVVSKVYSQGCGLEAGSAWPIGDDLFVTNAHVVAGGQQVRLEPPGTGRQLDATVVLYDPQVDVAVLRVPGTGLAPLKVGPDPARGLVGAVIGYPNGGGEQVFVAAVRGVEQAEGSDIYNNPSVTRTIIVLQATIIPGQSGGPVIDGNGTVVGLVFATSTTHGGEGYALAPSQIAADLQQARGARDAVSTQGCTN